MMSADGGTDALWRAVVEFNGAEGRERIDRADTTGWVADREIAIEDGKHLRAHWINDPRKYQPSALFLERRELGPVERINLSHYQENER